MKRVWVLALAAVYACILLWGCNAGDVSVDDVKKNAQAQADYLKTHPGRPDGHTE